MPPRLGSSPDGGSSETGAGGDPGENGEQQITPWSGAPQDVSGRRNCGGGSCDLLRANWPGNCPGMARPGRLILDIEEAADTVKFQSQILKVARFCVRRRRESGNLVDVGRECSPRVGDSG